MSTATYVPRSPQLNNAIDKFHHTFVDMLVGKTEEGKFVNKSDMYKAMQAAVSFFLLCTQNAHHIIIL